METAEFTPSDDVAKMFGEDTDSKAAYCAKFTFGVVPHGANQWAVRAFLKPEPWTNVVRSAQAAVLQIPIAELAAHLYGDPLADVPLTNCVPGFYYSLYNGPTVTNLKANVCPDDCNILCGPDTTVTIPVVPHSNPASGFYSIGVLEVPTVEPGQTETVTNLPSHRKPGDRSDIL